MELAEINKVAVLQKMAKNASHDDFIAFAEKVQLVCEEIKVQKSEKQEKEQQQLIQLEKLYAQIKSEGMDEELICNFLMNKTTGKVTPRTKREKLPPKYKYINEAGEEKNWSGGGRMPNALKALTDQGRSLNEFLIKKELSYN
jgi:DNA-binding protein H-NS